MIELVGLIGGGLMRLIPEITKFFGKKSDDEQAIKIAQIQYQIEQARSLQTSESLKVTADIAARAAEASALAQASQASSLGGWLNSSVRPILTYWWCLILYTLYKSILVFVSIKAGLPLGQIAPIILEEFDRVVIGSIVSFWFMDRTICRAQTANKY
jgi:hypothetical protein